MPKEKKQGRTDTFDAMSKSLTLPILFKIVKTTILNDINDRNAHMTPCIFTNEPFMARYNKRIT